MASQSADATAFSSTEPAGPGPGGPAPEVGGGWPLLGHLVEFQKDPVAMLTRCTEHGDLVRFRLGPREFALFAGPRAHDCYFRAPEDQLNAKAVYQFTVPIFGRGVAYDASAELMDEQVGFLFPALREAALQRFARIMFDEASLFADDLGEEGEIDLPQALNRLTVNIACRCIIGQEVRDQLEDGFAEAYHDLQKGINTLGFFLPRLPTPGHRARDRARRQVAALFAGIMAARRHSGAEPDDLMHTLMHARYKDGRPLSDDEITGVLLTALFAGQHTSAVLATWTGLELMREPEYLGRIREEMRTVYGDGDAVTLANLKKQLVLEYAVRENERLHPPLIILVRKVLRPLHYGDHIVPAGTLAMVSPAVSHRLPHVFANPDRFDPDRFAPPNGEDKQHRHALVGFGGGKHQCIGKHFAYLQLKAIWTVLLDRFDLELATPFPAPNYGSWVTGPEEPCRMRYRRRTKPSICR